MRMRFELMFMVVGAVAGQMIGMHHSRWMATHSAAGSPHSMGVPVDASPVVVVVGSSPVLVAFTPVVRFTNRPLLVFLPMGITPGCGLRTQRTAPIADPR